MRRRARERAAACSPEILEFLVPKTFFRWKATASPPCSKARRARTGGVVGTRREHKDGPETWETQALSAWDWRTPPRRVGRRRGRPKLRPTGVWESEGRIGAKKPANDWHRSRPSKGDTCRE